MTPQGSRFISRITSETLSIILAGGKGSRLKGLTDWRAKPAVPFGGKFRIIDFALSNCMNSQVRKVCVLTQYKAHSLIRHIHQGWGFLRGELGGFVEVIPAQQWNDSEEWFAGTADAVYQSLDILKSHYTQYALILSGDHVYKMDYGEMLAFHVKSQADFTVACTVVPREEAKGFGVMKVDEQQRIINFTEKPDSPPPIPGKPDHALASMGVYVFSMDYLIKEIERDARLKESSHDFGKDLIPHAVAEGHRAFAFPFQNPAGGDKVPYWQDVGELDSFFNTHMELLASKPPFDLFDRDWPIYSHPEQLPPARFSSLEGLPGVALNSMVSGGCVVLGAQVENSILSSAVEVGPGSRLDQVVALPHCNIGKNVRLSRVILDKGCSVPDGTVVGEDPHDDEARFERTKAGVVLITREMLGQKESYPSY
ncbi:MAG: glucose-1-phosphate adenylyltransferase [Magnetococcales bacterium]|nr:glucose-1-phosphate adenylyltransferase [Magnetococcales bacterium]